MAVHKMTAKQPEKNQPSFVVKAKVKSHDGSTSWVNIGAAWKATLPADQETGEVREGLSLKIVNPPLGWDGDALMVPPYKADDA